MRIFIVISIFISLVLLLSTCTKDVANKHCDYEFCSPGSVSYSTDIVPLIQKYCMTNLGLRTGRHGAWIQNYGSVKHRVDNGDIPREVLETREMPVLPNNFNI